MRKRIGVMVIAIVAVLAMSAPAQARPIVEFVPSPRITGPAQRMWPRWGLPTKPAPVDRRDYKKSPRTSPQGADGQKPAPEQWVTSQAYA